MNACLRDLSTHVIDTFRKAIAGSGIKGRFYLIQNDGTLMDAAFAEKFPVPTFACGPTNSMRGAAFLSGVDDAIFVDIRGTTSDVGSLVKGFPRQANISIDVGGVRTNFRMPTSFRSTSAAALSSLTRRTMSGSARLWRHDPDHMGRRRRTRPGGFRRPVKGGTSQAGVPRPHAEEDDGDARRVRRSGPALARAVACHRGRRRFHSRRRAHRRARGDQAEPLRRRQCGRSGDCPGCPAKWTASIRCRR